MDIDRMSGSPAIPASNCVHCEDSGAIEGKLDIVYEPLAIPESNCVHGADIGAKRKRLVLYEPPAIPAGGESGKVSGATREGFLPKPAAPRMNPPGMRIPGATPMAPESMACPKSIDKGKKLERRNVGSNVVIVQSNFHSGKAEKRGIFSTHSSKPVMGKSGGRVATEVKNHRGLAQAQGTTIIEFDTNVDELKRGADPRVKVTYFLRQFEKFRRRFQAKEKSRPDLKALHALSQFRNLVNGADGIYGKVPGVEVRDHYSYMAEIFLISLHRRIQGGIDFITEKNSTFTDKAGNPVSVAVSVVISPGGYEDDKEYRDTIWYTGQGGNNSGSNSNQLRPENQKLIGGNLALKNSSDLRLSVRVIRGYEIKKDEVLQSPSGRIYYYLGIYDVVDCCHEEGRTRVQVYKFKLVRQTGQKALV